MYSSSFLKSGSSFLAVAVTAFFAAGSAAIGAGGVSAPGPGIAFTRAWQTENLDGDFSQAAEEYERLYKLPAKADSPAYSPRLDRLRSAYRAGLCFEAIGNVRRARFAYQWIERNHVQITSSLRSKYPSDRSLQDYLRILNERCSLRSRRLKAAEPEAEVETRALDEVVAEFEEYNRKDKKILESFRQQVYEVSWRAAAGEELVGQLSRAGIEVLFPDRLATSGPDAGQLKSLVVSLQQSEVVQGSGNPLDLSTYLKRRFLQRALDALGREETDTAGRELSIALALDAGYAPALNLRDTLGRGGSISFLVRDARDTASRQQKRHAGEVRVKARGYLGSDAEASGRRARALRKLMSASRIFCLEPDAVISDGELSKLIARIRLGCLRSGGLEREKTIGKLLETTRAQLRTVLGLAEELVDLFSRGLFQQVSLRSRGGIRQEQVAAVLELAGAIKNEANDARVKANKSRMERLEFKLDRLEGWFPELKEFIRGP